MIPEEVLFEYVLGTLDAPTAQSVTAQLASSEALRAQLAEIEALLGGVGEALDPLTPSPQLRERLLEAATTTERWAPFVARLARLVDLAETEMRAVFERARDALSWEAGPIPTVRLLHFDGGAQAVAADSGLVRMAAGAVAPIHRHTGDEWVMVLEGSFVDLNTGVTHGPGEVIHHGPGSQHAFKVTDDTELFYALLLNADVQIVGWPSA